MPGFAVTFGVGQKPTRAFPEASPDTYLLILAPDEMRAREIAAQLFGPEHWSGIYARGAFEASRWAPGGCIGAISVGAL